MDRDLNGQNILLRSSFSAHSEQVYVLWTEIENIITIFVGFLLMFKKKKTFSTEWCLKIIEDVGNKP